MWNASWRRNPFREGKISKDRLPHGILRLSRTQEIGNASAPLEGFVSQASNSREGLVDEEPCFWLRVVSIRWTVFFSPLFGPRAPQASWDSQPRGCCAHLAGEVLLHRNQGDLPRYARRSDVKGGGSRSVRCRRIRECQSRSAVSPKCESNRG